jgi:ATP phosphoribosyltransferase
MIVIDGNDGTGKTTLAETLTALGYLVKDRGLPSHATDHGVPQEAPPPDVVYLILDAPEEVCQARLAAAGKDLHEKYHTPEDLRHYRKRFLEVAGDLDSLLIDAAGTNESVLQAALKSIGAAGNLRVGIPKGRLFEPLCRILEEHGGYSLSALPRRGLTISMNKVKFFVLKPRSIPQLVALEFLDAGFCGRDLMMESGYEDRLAVFMDTGLSPVKLCVGAPDPEIVNKPPARPLVIATEFPYLASRWAYSRGLAHICLLTWGSTEAWSPEFADIVIDVVETGETMEANGLVILDTILESSTVLIERKENSPLMHSLFARDMGKKHPADAAGQERSHAHES